MNKLREVLIKLIREKGFPVITEISDIDIYEDAIIWIQSEDEKIIEVRGEEFFIDEKRTLKDLTDEGLFKVYKEGYRQDNMKYEQLLDYLKEDLKEIEDEDEDNDELSDDPDEDIDPADDFEEPDEGEDEPEDEDDEDE